MSAEPTPPGPLVYCRHTGAVVNWPCADDCDRRCEPDGPTQWAHALTIPANPQPTPERDPMRTVHLAFTLAALWLGVLAVYLVGDAWGAAAATTAAVVLVVGAIGGHTMTEAVRHGGRELP